MIKIWQRWFVKLKRLVSDMKNKTYALRSRTTENIAAATQRLNQQLRRMDCDFDKRFMIFYAQNR